MHYWFVESMNDPVNDPIAFWTNGGPGCSGLLGFMTEQGPFKPNKDMSLSFNEYAWNKVSNMVFIESPAGVGFSKSTNPTEDLVTGDQQTAEDNYNLIQAFMERFPEYSSNALYISSESYGGHYMPTLAKEIVDMNAADNGKPVLNFKGFAVGNPYTDEYSGTGAMLDTFWGHQLIAKPTYDDYAAKCVNSLRPNIADCLQLQIEMNEQIGSLNVYALDYPVCIEDSKLSYKTNAQRTWMLNTLFSHVSEEDRKRLGVPSKEEYEPCEEDYTETYLNLDSVKSAIHVDTDIKWEPCSYKVQYNMSDSAISTAPIYNYLVDGGFGLDILVFSGDDDSVCATIGTQNWIWDLGYEVAGKQWKTYYVADQTAGYLTQWKNTKLGFLTIHGAGHEVPAYKPEVALDMWTRYLNGEFTNQ
jgi:carboxypeptidase C (cathepsin A)